MIMQNNILYHGSGSQRGRCKENDEDIVDSRCPDCQILLIQHDLGAVCPSCGLVYETIDLDQRPTYYDKHAQTQSTSYSPSGFRTMIGVGSERTSHYHKLNHIHYIFSKSPEEAARDCFRTYAASLDVLCHENDLLGLFSKIHRALPAFTRAKNIRRLCFGIFYQYERQFTVLSLQKALNSCHFTFHEIKQVLAVLSTADFAPLFSDAFEIQLFQLLAKAQIRFHLSPNAIGVIKGVLNDSSTCLGVRVNVLVGKALAIYYKSIQLQSLFQLLKSQKEITDWSVLMTQYSSKKWKTWVRTHLTPIPDIRTLANFCEVSPSQLYEAYNRYTWINYQLLSTEPHATVNFGTLKVPETCFDLYFYIIRNRSRKLKKSLESQSLGGIGVRKTQYWADSTTNTFQNVKLASVRGLKTSRKHKIPLSLCNTTEISFVNYPKIHLAYVSFFQRCIFRFTDSPHFFKPPCYSAAYPRSPPCAGVGLSKF